MPRLPDPLNAAQQARQRRYRERLTRRQVPEAGAVDLALAASTAAYIDAIEAKLGTDADRRVLKLLLRGALDLLAAAGYERAEAASVLRRRVTRDGRVDLERLVEVSRVRMRIRQYR